MIAITKGEKGRGACLFLDLEKKKGSQDQSSIDDRLVSFFSSLAVADGERKEDPSLLITKGE